MPVPGASRFLQTSLLVLVVMSLCSAVCGRVIYVDDDEPADSSTIQGGINAAEYGDTVSVAPGVYFENVALKGGVDLIGAGAGVTIIDAGGYGDVVDARADGTVISGFTLRNSGQFDLGHMNCGVYCRGDYSPVVENNVITGNRIGIGLWDEADLVVRNNIIENNSDGFYMYGSVEHPTNPTIVNNTIVNNQTHGITLRVMVSPLIINNIIAGHVNGINNNYVTGSPVISYNNLWLNGVNYLLDNMPDETLAGPGSISVDPLFVDPNNGDYHLESEAGRWDPVGEDWVIDDFTSPCIDAGDPNSPVGLEPAPNGNRINIGAHGGTAEASKSPSGSDDKYSGGTGEPNDPCRIATAEDLMLLGETPEDYDKHFILTADIDLDPNLPGRKVFDRAVIAPYKCNPEEGYPTTPFSGVFDGNGFTVSNLTIIGDDFLGMFGRLGRDWPRGGEVENLGLIDVDIISSGGFAGGLVARSMGTISACYSTGSVSSLSIDEWWGTVGGLVAWNREGMVADSYSTCSVSGWTSAGLVAQNGEGPPPDEVWFGCHTGIISNCYSTGGSLIAVNECGEVTDSFWDIETSGQTTSAGGLGKTTAEMQTADTFILWSVCGDDAVWTIDEGNDYPRLWWEEQPGRPIEAIRPSEALAGTGTRSDPYLICTAGEFRMVGLMVCDWDKHFKLVQDINLSGSEGADICLIGRKHVPFTGTFDGNGYSISGFNCVSTDEDFIGLFRYVSDPNAEIKNLTLIDPNVYAINGSNVGSLVGTLSRGTLSNCHIMDGSVRGGRSDVGGLLGANYGGGTVTACTSMCEVSGSREHVGGLAGSNSGSITTSYSCGTVSGEYDVGGLVGDNHHRDSTISMSYSSSIVTGNMYVGGLVGQNVGSSITNSYATGAVSGDIDVGGLAGINGYYSTIAGSYSTGTVMGFRSVGGLIGLNHSVVATSYSKGTVTGDMRVGGLVGESNSSDSVITTSFSTGKVSGYEDVGGLVGHHRVGVASACFWDIETSGLLNMCGIQVQAHDARGCDDRCGKTTAEMQTAGTFLEAGWDFAGETDNGTDDTWWILEGQDYPRLWWELAPAN